MLWNRHWHSNVPSNWHWSRDRDLLGLNNWCGDWNWVWHRNSDLLNLLNRNWIVNWNWNWHIYWHLCRNNLYSVLDSIKYEREPTLTE